MRRHKGPWAPTKIEREKERHLASTAAGADWDYQTLDASHLCSLSLVAALSLGTVFNREPPA